MSSYDGLSLEDVKVGDAIEVRNGYGANPCVVTVEKVGRSLVTVTIYGRPVRFEIASGIERRSATAGGSGARALTATMWEQVDRKFAALRTIRAAQNSLVRLPVATLETIARLVEASE